MRPNRSAVPWLVFALTGQPAASARSAPPGAAPAPQSSQIPTFGVGTAAVTLDVVVRDKKGKALRDLQASDFEVYEDGVKQRVETFEVFGRPLGEPEAADTKAPAPAPPAPAIPAPRPAATPADLETRPQVIAFVFDRLSPNARNNP